MNQHHNKQNESMFDHIDGQQSEQRHKRHTHGPPFMCTSPMKQKKPKR